MSAAAEEADPSPAGGAATLDGVLEAGQEIRLSIRQEISDESFWHRRCTGGPRAVPLYIALRMSVTRFAQRLGSKVWPRGGLVEYVRRFSEHRTSGARIWGRGNGWRGSAASRPLRCRRSGGGITLSRLAEEAGLGRGEAARFLGEAGVEVRVPNREDVAAESGLA